jgi:hypothetical protein
VHKFSAATRDIRKSRASLLGRPRAGRPGCPPVIGPPRLPAANGPTDQPTSYTPRMTVTAAAGERRRPMSTEDEHFCRGQGALRQLVSNLWNRHKSIGQFSGGRCLSRDRAAAHLPRSLRASPPIPNDSRVLTPASPNVKGRQTRSPSAVELEGPSAHSSSTACLHLLGLADLIAVDSDDRAMARAVVQPFARSVANAWLAWS